MRMRTPEEASSFVLGNFSAISADYALLLSSIVFAAFKICADVSPKICWVVSEYALPMSERVLECLCIIPIIYFEDSAPV